MEQKLKGQTASIVEFIFGGLFVLSGIGYMRISALWGFAYIIFGAFLVVTGIQWRLLIKDYRSYMTVLSNDPTGSLTTISQATNTSVTAVKDNLKLMIKKGLVKDLIVSEQENRVLRNMGTTTAVASAPASSPVVAETTIITCSGCGAKNEVVKGATAQCDHCGAALQS